MFKEVKWVVIYRDLRRLNLLRSILSQDSCPIFAVTVTGIQTYLFLFFSGKTTVAVNNFWHFMQ